MANSRALTLADFPMLRERQAADESDLLQRTKKKMRGGAEVGFEEQNGSFVSYANKLKGESRGELETDQMEEEGLDDFGITIVHHLKGNMKIPELVFSEEGRKKLRKPFAKSLIVKLLGWRLSLRSMEMKLQSLWGKLGTVSVVDLRNDFFVVNFTNWEDYHRALSEGPWLIADHYLTVREWRGNFNPLTEVLEEVLVWVRLSDLPLECYGETVLQAIGDQIGKTVKVDATTLMQTRGKFARIGVQVDLSKPLLPQFLIEGREFNVEYEGLHSLCYHCGMYGHGEKDCADKVEETSKMNEGMEECEGQDRSRSLYGEWTLVQKRRGPRRAGMERRGFVSSGGVGADQSRFNGLEVEELDRVEEAVGNDRSLVVSSVATEGKRKNRTVDNRTWEEVAEEWKSSSGERAIIPVNTTLARNRWLNKSGKEGNTLRDDVREASQGKEGKQERDYLKELDPNVISLREARIESKEAWIDKEGGKPPDKDRDNDELFMEAVEESAEMRVD
ncbi:uncharacterized protein LOC114750477 [Neltuma alba]|uniref:uncharacterized protein LOC114750477 n=1 Tax=Neltuma alba TaxID=207710 RepID=UPI0010A2C5B1|nr:uncharacterized protein LOC114750477 [Prosopis alba]